MTAPTKPTLPSPLQELLPPELRPLCVRRPGVKRERIFTQGMQPSHMFFVVDGEVVLQRVGRQGEIRVLQRVRQGWIAEASLQSPRYHCDAVVAVPSDLVGVPVAAVRQALLGDPAFAMRWIDMLNHELKRLRARAERLSLKSVRDRLVHLVETEGRHGRLPIGAGLKSIAAELGVTHEALYRTVAEMEKQGVVRRDGMHVQLTGG